MARPAVIATLVSLAAAFLLQACEEDHAVDEIGIVTTIAPLTEFTEVVGGDKVDVTTLIPPGSSPHTYEPTPNQLVKLSGADMYVKAGSGVEFEIIWMDKIRSVSGGMLIVDASKGIELLAVEEVTGGHEHGHSHSTESHAHEHGGDDSGETARPGADPHVWLSPVNAGKMVSNICEGLMELDPTNEPYYMRNRDAYLEELEELDGYIRGRFAGVPGSRFLIYHPAWGYFADEYGLEQIAVEHGGKEPTAREMVRIVSRAEELGIRGILVEPRSSTVSAEVIAEELGGSIVFADPLAGDYIHNMRQVADRLAEVLK